MVLAQRARQAAGCGQHNTNCHTSSSLHTGHRSRAHLAGVPRTGLLPLSPLHAAQAHSHSADYPQILAYWERLRVAAAAASGDAAVAASHPQEVAEQWLHQQVAGPLTAAAVAVPEQTKCKAPGTAGLVRSRVVKNRRGYWRIRHFQPTDLTAVADLQSAAFYEALPVGALDKLAYTMFRAEVLDALKKKVSVLSDDTFAMMVVESCQLGSMDASAADSISDSDSDAEQSGDWDWDTAVWYGDQQAAVVSGTSVHSASTTEGSSCHTANAARHTGIMGVVEVGVDDERDVLQHMNGQYGSYAYISSMAVSPQLRRSGIGRALLHAAEQQAANWNQGLVALHVFATNMPAIRLYERHGMRCTAQDPAWKGLLGGKVRQLMVKELQGCRSEGPGLIVVG